MADQADEFTVRRERSLGKSHREENSLIDLLRPNKASQKNFSQVIVT